MALTATEKWSAHTYTRGVRASRTYTVSDAVTEEQAATAPGVPAQGSGYALDARLRAQAPEVRKLSPYGWYEVTVAYERPESAGGTNGNETPQEVDDLLNLLPRYSWSTGIDSVEIDYDIYGHPILNTAGIPFANNPTTTEYSSFLTVRRWQSQFDLSMAKYYRAKVNSNVLRIPRGDGDIEPLQLLCIDIVPLGEYDANTLVVEVEYRFHLKDFSPQSRSENDGRVSPHDWSIANVGTDSWATSGSAKVRGRLVYSDGNEVQNPVALDTYGKPVDSTLKVRTITGNLAPESAPLNIYVPPTDGRASDNRVLWLRYAKYASVDFAGLNLFF